MPKLVLDDGTEIPIVWATLPRPLEWRVTEWQKQVSDLVPNGYVMVCAPKKEPEATPTVTLPPD